MATLAELAGPLALVLSRLGRWRRGRKRWISTCPSHRAERFTLTITVGRDRRILLVCAAGCRAATIARRLGLSLDQLAERDGGTTLASPHDEVPEPKARLEGA